MPRRLVIAIFSMVIPLLGSMSAPALSATEGAATQGATAWINVPGNAAPDLHGKVVVVQFWTYTCVNWRRTLPYLRAWSAKYRDRGLVVIGVHTPEFDFEKNPDNVRWAIKNMQIDYPVAMDNAQAIWNAFHNVYWPALYLIDAQGHIRYQQFGEGEYARTEREIQKLLGSSGQRSGELVSITPLGAELSADLATLRSPETYVGYEMAERFASKGGAVPNRPHDYAIPEHLSTNQWALSGSWSIEGQAAVLHEGGGKVAYRFHARDLNLIMAPSNGGSPTRFHVLIDGQPPGSAKGADVDASGYGTLDEARMYQLIRQPGKISDQELRIEFMNSGVRVYDFTFG